MEDTLLFGVCCEYCATSQGLLDWFEIDLMRWPSFFIQSDVRFVYSYYLFFAEDTLLFGSLQIIATVTP